MARLTKREIDLLFGGGLIGFAVGGIGMYFVVQQQMKTKYAEIADAEIQEVKAHYRAKEMELVQLQQDIARQPKPHLAAMMEDLGYTSKDEDLRYGGHPVGDHPNEDNIPEEEEVDAEAVEETAFTELPPWDMHREMAARRPEFPFIIHKEEFFADDSYDHQVTITYFEGDDVLVDESDEVMTKKDEVVGMENLTKFGHGSDDPNVLYVRNAKLQVDYEILRHRGHYAKEILGLEEEPNLEHSAIPRRRRRFDDDG